MSIFSKTRDFFKLILLMSGLLFVSCIDNDDTKGIDPIVHTIHKSAIEDVLGKSDDNLDLTNMFEFDWDELYIYAPYTSKGLIEKELGVVSPEIERIGITERDDICVLVFVNQNKIIKVIPYPREKGDFSKSDSHNPIMRSSALFKVVENTDEPGWLNFNLVGMEKHRSSLNPIS